MSSLLIRRRILSELSKPQGPIVLFDSTVSPAIGVEDWKPYFNNALDRALVSDTGIYLNEYLNKGTPACAWSNYSFVKYAKPIVIRPGSRIEITVDVPRTYPNNTAAKNLSIKELTSLTNYYTTVYPLTYGVDTNAYSANNATAIADSPITFTNFSGDTFVYTGDINSENIALHHHCSVQGNTTRITKVVLYP